VDRLEELHRAELKAKTDIRAVLDRFDVLDQDVDEAMLSVNDTLNDLLAEAEGDLTYEIEGEERGEDRA
jgi:hypothetical protein